ncbi:hypothetical protein L195_g064096, partial [Trifolium pratense]
DTRVEDPAQSWRACRVRYSPLGVYRVGLFA